MKVSRMRLLRSVDLFFLSGSKKKTYSFWNLDGLIGLVYSLGRHLFVVSEIRKSYVFAYIGTACPCRSQDSPRKESHYFTKIQMDQHFLFLVSCQFKEQM